MDCMQKNWEGKPKKYRVILVSIKETAMDGVNNKTSCIPAFFITHIPTISNNYRYITLY